MRKTFVILAALVTMLLVGCATTKPAYHSKMPADSVYIDPYNSWMNNCVRGCDSPWRAVTVRVINTKYREVGVTVKCFYMPEKTLFGEQTKVIQRRDDATFFIMGFARGVSEKVSCGISNIR